MYTNYWHLNESPFENFADPRFAYLSDQHREGLARLLYLVRGRKLGGILTGPYGVGKSMVLEMISQGLQSHDSNASRFVKFDVPPGGTSAFVRRMFQALGDSRPPADSAEALQRLDAIVAGEGELPGCVSHTVLAVDEAQLIREPEIFELLHLVTNLRRPEHEGDPSKPLFTLLLVGHDELIKALENQPSLRQRLQLLWKLKPLDVRQTAEYVKRRLTVAGGDGIMFEDDAIREIQRASRGLPRLINNLCDLSLMMGYASGATRIGREIVALAVEDGPDTLSAGSS